MPIRREKGLCPSAEGKKQHQERDFFIPLFRAGGAVVVLAGKKIPSCGRECSSASPGDGKREGK